MLFARSIEQASPAHLYRVKGSVFRAYLSWLAHEKRLDSTRARVSAETALLMATPPLPSTWVDAAVLDELVMNIEADQGAAGVKRAAHFILKQQMGTLLAPMAQGVLTIIGTSPARLYSRWSDLVRSVMEGIETEWRSTSERSGVLRITYPGARTPVPLRVYLSSVAGLEEGLRLCGRTGTVSDPVAVASNAADFTIEWQAGR